MLPENLKNINAYSVNQPVIIVDGVAYPIGYSTDRCTATAEDIAEGKTAATAAGIVTGTLSVQSISIAKISEYKTPHDAFTAVSSVDVSGIGMIDTWDGEEDYSSWNGTYNVTEDTESISDLNGRVFKHASESKYLYRILDVDWSEYFWVLAEHPFVTDHYAAAFNKRDTLASGQWETKYEGYVSITVNTVNTDYPKQELVITGKTASYSDDEGFVVGTTDVSFTEFEDTPIVGNCYLYSGNKLFGHTVALGKANAVPTDLTSNTSHAGYVVNQSHGSGEYPKAYVVFNQNYTQNDYAWYSGSIGMTQDPSTSPQCWFSVELPNAIKPTGIFIMNEIQSPEYFKTAVFQGCNDGASWEDIVELTNVGMYGYKQTVDINTQNEYKYFRMLFTSSYGRAVSIQAFMIYKAEYKEQ